MRSDKKPLMTRREALAITAFAMTALGIDSMGAQTPPATTRSPEALGGKPPAFFPAVEWEFDVRIQWDGRHPTGVFNAGQRIYNVALGGEFAGPRLQGRVVPGGGDWALMRPADAPFEGNSKVERLFTFDARYMLQTSDGVYIYVTNRGYGSRPPDTGGEVKKRRGISTPIFDTPLVSAYAFLSQNVYIGLSEALGEQTLMHVYRVTG